ncbi:gamma subclass chorismate mutase AroQ [Oceanibaculum nanhaiense]|uniref:gamma subclass chorismate mutase AroQ n=1 Tax=Oceanibaculum nanhaiense TaxID=1909734 RepID=UPI00396DC147
MPGIFKRAFLMLVMLILSLATPLSAPIAQTAGQEPLHRLADLLDQRLELGVEVARAKWNSGQPIQDTVREQAVIEATVARALEIGIEAGLARQLITDQITASRLLQQALHDEWRRTGQPPFTDAADLRRDLRPKFDALGPELLRALKDAEARLQTATGRAAMRSAGAEAMAHRPEAVRERALALFQ